RWFYICRLHHGPPPQPHGIEPLGDWAMGDQLSCVESLTREPVNCSLLLDWTLFTWRARRASVERPNSLCQTASLRPRSAGRGLGGPRIGGKLAGLVPRILPPGAPPWFRWPLGPNALWPPAAGNGSSKSLGWQTPSPQDGASAPAIRKFARTKSPLR